MRQLRAILFSGLTLLPMATLADSYVDHPRAQSMLAELQAEGADMARVRQVLAGAERLDAVLESIARPAERTHTWGSYQKIFLQQSRADQAAAFATEHLDALQRAEQTFGVDRTIILAIIGVETRYGQHMGNYRAVDALATLGLDYPPRADFFRRQLKALFELDQLDHIDAAVIKGSYAGALGYGQFIPTSYQAYAVDFDGDGIIDLVNNPTDAIGSVANYFAEHRWQAGLPVAARARVDGNGYQALVKKGYKPTFTLADARNAGVSPVSCNATITSEYCFDLPDDTPVALLELEGTDGAEFWLATNNFYAITRYNHSPLYAMAVLQLSRWISNTLETEQ